MTRYSPLIASLVSVAFAAVAHAHPGHGKPGDDFSLAHYVTEPFHLGVGLCMIVVSFAVFGLLRAVHMRRRRQEPEC